MSRLESTLVWFGGYAPRTLSEETLVEREAISKLGGAVLFATMVAFLNWGVATWVYSDGLNTWIRVAVACAGGSIGGIMAAVFDRSFLYFADTAPEGGRFKLFTYAFVRILIILIIGSFTSQAVIPVLLSSELKAQALQMTEASEKTRQADLNSRYQIEKKETDLKSAGKEVETLRLAMANLPYEIQSKLISAKACWSEYGAEKETLLKEGNPLSEALEKLSDKKASCIGKSSTANVEREEYVSRIRTQLSQAVQARQTRDTEVTETKSAIKSKVARAELVESESFNPKSSTVLWSLLKNNPGALGKWLLLSSILLLLELLPLILKFQSGQSSVGRRIANTRTITQLDLAARLQQSEHDFKISSVVSKASREAVSEALLNPEVRAIFARAFAANIAAFAPVEAVRAMMRDLEAKHIDVDQFMSRFPKLATVIAQAWSQAVKNTSEILSKGVNIEPVG